MNMETRIAVLAACVASSPWRAAGQTIGHRRVARRQSVRKGKVVARGTRVSLRT